MRRISYMVEVLSGEILSLADGGGVQRIVLAEGRLRASNQISTDKVGGLRVVKTKPLSTFVNGGQDASLPIVRRSHVRDSPFTIDKQN